MADPRVIHNMLTGRYHIIGKVSKFAGVEIVHFIEVVDPSTRGAFPISVAADELISEYEFCFMLAPYHRDVLTQRAVAVAKSENATFLTPDHVNRAWEQVKSEDVTTW